MKISTWILIGLTSFIIFMIILFCCTWKDREPTYDVYNGDLWLEKSSTESQSIVLNDGTILFKAIHYQYWDDFINLKDSTITYTNRFQHYYLKNITLHYQWTQKEINNYLH